jgi:hypothetical protein
MSHTDTNREPHSRTKTLRRGLLCLAVLSLCTAGLTACDGKPRLRLELVARVPTDGAATAVAWDAARQVVYVGAGDAVTGFVETSPGQWSAKPDSTVTLPGQPTAIEATSALLYVALDGGVYAFDAQQSMAASYAGPFVVEGLQAHGESVYAALNWHSGVYLCGLHVLSASELAKLGAIDEPVAIGFVCTPETVFNGVAVAPPLAYVVGDSVCGQQYAKAFLGIVDVSQPGDPLARGKVELDYLPASAIALAGDYAYVAGMGLYVVDVSDPEAPRQVTRFAAPRELADVAVSLPYVYVCDVTGRVLAIDVSDPAAPRAASAWFETGFAAHDLSISLPYLYLANDAGGLAVLRANVQ